MQTEEAVEGQRIRHSRQQPWPQRRIIRVAEGTDHIQPIHRAAQQDDDQPIVARSGGKGDRREERAGGTAADQERPA